MGLLDLFLGPIRTVREFVGRVRKGRHALLPVLITYFLDTFGLAVIYPVFTPLLISSGHSILSPEASWFEKTTVLGLLIAIFPLAQFFSTPLIGQFSDRFGRKRAFYITILGTSVGYTITALSIMHDSLAGLFFSRFATGLFAGNLTLCLAAISDLSHDDIKRTRNFSLLSAIGGMSFIVAIAFGGILSNPDISRHFNPSFPFWITALLSFINLGFMIVLFEETHKGPRHPGFNPFRGIYNLKRGIQSKELRILYSVNFLFKLAWVAGIQFFPAFLIEHYKFSINQITFSLIMVSLSWSLTNLFINRTLAKHYFPGVILLASLLALSFCYLFTIANASSIAFLILFCIATGLGALCWTNGIATVSLKAPLAIQGSVLGINQSFTSMATMLGPIIGGPLAALGVHLIYIFGGIVCLAAFCLLLSHKAYESHSHVD